MRSETAALPSPLPGLSIKQGAAVNVGASWQISSEYQVRVRKTGTGSGTHINAEKFRLAAGIDVVHIPYKGTPEALTDTMTGRITYFFSPISAALRW